MQITLVVSKFGLGHLTRQFALCEEIKNIYAETKFQLVLSEHHEQMFKQTFNLLNARTFSNFISPTFTLNSPGEIDVESSLYSYQMAIDFDTQIRNDTGWGEVLEGTDILINDIEFFHNPIAKKMGIPIVNISNFTWSDILKPYATAALTNNVMQFELMSDLNIKLPFATKCLSFTDYEEFGLLARRVNTNISDQVKDKFDENLPIILVTSIPPKLQSIAHTLLQLSESYNLLLTPQMGDESSVNANQNIVRLPSNTNDIQNYVNAADLVIGKTGYGLVSECVSTSTPLLYWTRKGWVEDSALSAGLKSMNLGSEFNQDNLDGIDVTIEEIIDNRGKSMPIANREIAERILKLR